MSLTVQRVALVFVAPFAVAWAILRRLGHEQRGAFAMTWIEAKGACAEVRGMWRHGVKPIKPAAS